MINSKSKDLTPFLLFCSSVCHVPKAFGTSFFKERFRIPKHRENDRKISGNTSPVLSIKAIT
ncbi:MAG: hypothetical protein Q8N09_02060 [Thermodesulfovibrionia bacterium]|nr:hypothetical protein [Thermodesulfovibrionia bacterium]